MTAAAAAPREVDELSVRYHSAANRRPMHPINPLEDLDA